MLLACSTQYTYFYVLSIIFSCINNKALRCVQRILFCHNKILLFKQFMTFFLQEAWGARIVVSYLLSIFLLCEL